MPILERSSISNRFRVRAHRRVHRLPIDCLPTFAVRNRVCHLHDCAARPEHQRRMTTVPRLRLVALVEWSKAVLVSFAVAGLLALGGDGLRRSEEHTSELQSLMRISYAVFCLKKKNKNTYQK